MIEKEFIENIEKYTVQNESIRAEFISFGARMTKLIVKGIDVLLGYDRIEDYTTDTLFIGATVGRFAGRIGNTTLTINGNRVFLDQNENGTTCHHGGYNAFDKKNWKGKILSDYAIEFSHVSESGEGGFPGNLEVSVRFTVLPNGVEILHRAKSDQDTIVNLTNHAYFNLAGFNHDDARQMSLQLNSTHYLPLNDKLIPTGEVANSKGTKFDFTNERKIETDLDHFFIFDKNEGTCSNGTLYSPLTNIRMMFETDQPGVQIYTCGAFEADKGKGGIPLHKNQGIALEMQGYPDSPNHKNFPTNIIKSNEMYQSTARFLFS